MLGVCRLVGRLNDSEKWECIRLFEVAEKMRLYRFVKVDQTRLVRFRRAIEAEVQAVPVFSHAAAME